MGERHLPSDRRGLFVGISGIFYAAKAAHCDGKVLQQHVFLECLEKRRDELMAEGGHKGRDIANLTLVTELVRHVLHRTAFIVCKRNWRVGEGGGMPADFVATWTLGLYLKHSGIMGIPLRVMNS